MSKKQIFFDEAQYSNDLRNNEEQIILFNKTFAEANKMLLEPLTDCKAFKNDAYNVTLEAIKTQYPKPFELGLTIDKTLDMLSFDLTNIKHAGQSFITHPARYIFKNGIAENDYSKEPYIWYATTVEELERYDYCMELIKILNNGKERIEGAKLYNMNRGLINFVIYDLASETLIPNHCFVKNNK
jgi:hypothetical protein